MKFLLQIGLTRKSKLPNIKKLHCIARISQVILSATSILSVLSLLKERKHKNIFYNIRIMYNYIICKKNPSHQFYINKEGFNLYM